MKNEQHMDWQEELPWMPEYQEDSEPGIMPSTRTVLQLHSHSDTVELEDHDIKIQLIEELGQVDSHFNNIARLELEGANDPNEQAQKEIQADNADVNWSVTVPV